jgi:hypothetical protein
MWKQMGYGLALVMMIGGLMVCGAVIGARGGVASVAAQAPGISMQCGQGVIVRGGDQVLLDRWQSFTPPTTTEDHPSKVTLGSTLADTVQVCAETAAETRCLPLKDLRALIAKGAK